MSEPAGAQCMGETTEQPTGIAWGDPIGPERLAELKELFERQRVWAEQEDRAIEQSVFQGVKLTGADVFWLTALALAEQENGDLSEAARKLREYRQFGFSAAMLHLEGADLSGAQLQNANLRGAHLSGANLSEAQLQESDLRGTELTDANLRMAQVAGANLLGTRMERSRLRMAELKDSDLSAAQMQDTDLRGAHLENVRLHRANLEHSDLSAANLTGADLSEARLPGANLRGAAFDKNSRLNETILDGASLDQVIFDNTSLVVISWDGVRHLGDERIAKETTGVRKKAAAFHAAARAYRSLSVNLRNQGLGTEATRFHYRSELMERKSLFWQIFARLRSWRFYMAPGYFGRWLFSWLLGTFAGYGDYFGRLLLTYVIVVSAFAGLMFLASGRVVSFDSIRDVFVLSITSFHGRGNQPPGLHLTDALATLTAVEAFFGLLIEGIFIAAFTRRVTGN
jgi:uncharacterized protein YjbI with pentapeptide repeats